MNKLIRTELWDGHEIRFVEKEPGEWWAIAADVSDALNYRMPSDMMRYIDDDEKCLIAACTLNKRTPDAHYKISLISELGIYDAIFSSRKPEAKAFKKWVYGVIEELRKASGLEGFQIFRMLDKEHQKEAMTKLKAGLRKPVRVDFIKANTITNKAVSTIFGYDKMVKKNDMTPEMLLHRQPVLDDTIELMSANDKFNLGLSISGKIRERYQLGGTDHGRKKANTGNYEH